jgi:hypothetical protein
LFYYYSPYMTAYPQFFTLDQADIPSVIAIVVSAWGQSRIATYTRLFHYIHSQFVHVSSPVQSYSVLGFQNTCNELPLFPQGDLKFSLGHFLSFATDWWHCKRQSVFIALLPNL